MGDRTLEDIVKEALAEGRGTLWIAEECWINDLTRLVPKHLHRQIKIERAQADLEAAQARLSALRRESDEG